MLLKILDFKKLFWLISKNISWSFPYERKRQKLLTFNNFCKIGKILFIILKDKWFNCIADFFRIKYLSFKTGNKPTSILMTHRHGLYIILNTVLRKHHTFLFPCCLFPFPGMWEKLLINSKLINIKPVSCSSCIHGQRIQAVFGWEMLQLKICCWV